MADFNIRSDSVDVEQIMQQIRTRIGEKRGVDYTEEQVRELATVRLERFLDPKNLRSDLIAQFRQSRPPLPEIDEPPIIPAPKEPTPVEPPYTIDGPVLVQTHRGLLRFVRRLFAPIQKLFWNINTLHQILWDQANFNVELLKRDQRRRLELADSERAFALGFYELKRQGALFERSRAEWNILYYEVLHNLVLETTRSAIEVKNLKMRVEALASRLDFSERRVRALEGVVQYRPEAPRRPQQADGREPSRPSRAEGPTPVETSEAATTTNPQGGPAASPGLLTPSESRRRRRRRRGRRPGGPMPETTTAAGEISSSDAGESSAADTFDGDEGPDGFDDQDPGAPTDPDSQ